MDTIVLGFACLVTLAFYVATRPGVQRTGIYLPDFLIAGIATYAIGAGGIYVAGGYPGAHSVMLMAELALFSATMGLIYGLLLFERRYPKDYIQHNLVHWRFGDGEEKGIYWGLTVSSVVCALFTISVLRNQALFTLLGEVFRISDSGTSTLLEARKAITNGTEGYLAPGFVKQFRDVLVPILMAAVILTATRKPLKFRQKVIVVTSAVSAMVAMALTGIRSNLFIFLVALYMARVFVQRVRRKKRKTRRQLLLVIAALAIYGMLTILLGRVNGDGSHSSPTIDVFANLLDRIFMAAPRENIRSYPFWAGLSPAMGKYWIVDLSGILPGTAPVGLSNLLHQYNGGSIEGNSSLGLPVDVWINWGWVGLLVFPLLYGLLIVYFDCKLANMRSPVAFGIKIVSALALLIIYNPFGFVLYGGALSLLLYLVLKAVRGTEFAWSIPVSRPRQV